MKKNLEGWSLVILGYWDPRVITPAWLLQNKLTNSKTIGVALPQNNFVLPPRFEYDDIYLKVSNLKLELAPKFDQNNIFEQIKDNALLILQTLPHTPIQGLGVNFGFIDENPDANLLALFSMSDDAKISDCNFIITTKNIIRSVTFDFDRQEQILNLNFLLTSNNHVKLDINFHKSVQSTTEVSEFLADGILRFRDKTFNLLNELYNIEII